MSTLTSLPLELRREIYSYLLDARRTSPDASDEGYEPKYATSLFLVSKRISEESLEFFYDQNVFATITFNSRFFLSQSQLDQVQRATLAKTITKAPLPARNRRFLLQIGLKHRDFFLSCVQFPPDVLTLIVPSHGIDSLLGILRNCEGFHSRACMLSTCCDPYFDSRIRDSGKNQRILQGVETSKRSWGYREVPEISQRYREVVLGDCDGEPTYSTKETLWFCQQQMKYANSFAVEGSYESAVRAAELVNLCARSDHREHSQRGLLLTVRNLLLEMQINSSDWLLEMGEYLPAGYLLLKADRTLEEYSTSLSFYEDQDECFYQGSYLYPLNPFQEPLQKACRALALAAFVDIESPIPEALEDDRRKCMQKMLEDLNDLAEKIGSRIEAFKKLHVCVEPESKKPQRLRRILRTLNKLRPTKGDA